jgi:hypothetical protein
MSQENLKTLYDLAYKWGTDKAIGAPGYHGYSVVYENLFKNVQNNEIRLLEIGVASGQSIAMWYEYFINSKIHCIDDINRKLTDEIVKELTQTNRVFFQQGDQGDRLFLTSMYNLFGGEDFDIIVDDGSHQPNHQMISFAHLFPHLKSGGYYIIEDITIPESEVILNVPNNIETYNTIIDFKDKGILKSNFVTDDENLYLQNNILNIEIHYSNKESSFPPYGKWGVAIIEKK